MENKNCCGNKAEWVIYDDDQYTHTYSCFDHLQEMISDKTNVIQVVGEDCKETCCYIAQDQEQTNVNHPKHYNNISGVECIDVVEQFNFNLGSAIKYLWRHRDKENPIEDLEKAIWYTNREIERIHTALENGLCPFCSKKLEQVKFDLCCYNCKIKAAKFREWIIQKHEGGIFVPFTDEERESFMQQLKIND